ncbi:MAG TPA: hypothetical protein VMS18_22590 [Candidatus Binatia bacterium]|nr:hypothetical protein [Candidatus Binatia bacterium]
MTESTPSESRRSTRVPLKVAISVEGQTDRTCEGTTEIVNLHGALIHTEVELPYAANIDVHVILTDKRAKARIVYINPLNRLMCGIELEHPENIWGVPLPPKDWNDSSISRARQ